MRLWSLHPKYLDPKGLVALWREGLLARKVLLGQTIGYRHHPQLLRFSAQRDPLRSIDRYLMDIYREAESRGYAFDRSKIGRVFSRARINVTTGQLRYEQDHLKKKLRKRDPAKLKVLRHHRIPEHHPLFRPVPGAVEVWESGPKQKSRRA